MLELVQLTLQDRQALNDMFRDWEESGEKMISSALTAYDYHDFEADSRYLPESETHIPGFVPASMFFASDRERQIFGGAVNIRHRLNAKRLQDGGHSGDGVRPSERRGG